MAIPARSKGPHVVDPVDVEIDKQTKEIIMARINLGNGRWFNPESAEQWEESTRWDGRNHISVPTGSQWEHEELYRTRSGAWILHTWSQWQGSAPSYSTIDESTARTWLVDNDHGDAVERLFPGALAASMM